MFFLFRCLRKKVPFLVHAHTVFPHPSPMSSMLKRGGEGRNDSSDVMSMGIVFSQTPAHKKGCWVCRVCASCLVVTHAQWTRALMAACRKLMAALQHKQQCKTQQEHHQGSTQSSKQTSAQMFAKHMTSHIPRHATIRLRFPSFACALFWNAILT